MRRVRQKQTDMNPRPHAKLLQTARCPVREISELAVADPLDHEVDRGVVGPFGDGVVQDLVHRSGHDLRVPADPGGVGTDPGLAAHALFLLPRSRVQTAVTPPSTAKVWPVINAQASEANNAVAPLRSSGPPLRFIGAIFAAPSWSSFAVILVGK